MRTAAERILRAALLLSALLAGHGAQAEPPALVGLFEGHGIAPPRDPAKARAAVAGAQRLGTLCASFYQQRGGGTDTAITPCHDGGKQLAGLGPDGASAILDVLDEPHAVGPRMESPTPALLSALADTGREDLVPVLITALERMAARTSLGDERVRSFARWSWSSLNDALTTLTFLEKYEQTWSTGSSNDTIPPVAAGWRAWWEKNKSKPRAVWHKESLARARAAVAGSDLHRAEEAAVRIANARETRAEGITALKRIVRDPRCEEGCWTARQRLHEAEPRAHWLPR